MSLKFFYDPVLDREWQVEIPSNPDWIRISEAQASLILEARQKGARVYVNTYGLPDVFYAPQKPPVKWNEYAELSPYSVTNGVPFQEWLISKRSTAEQGKLLAALRWQKQVSGLLYRNIDQEWCCTTDRAIAGPVWIPTDIVTMTTLGLIKGDYDKGINETRTWKIKDLQYVKFTNEELVGAYRKGQEHWQNSFDIEAAYGNALSSGIDVDIYQWQLVEY